MEILRTDKEMKVALDRSQTAKEKGWNHETGSMGSGWNSTSKKPGNCERTRWNGGSMRQSEPEKWSEVKALDLQ